MPRERYAPVLLPGREDCLSPGRWTRFRWQTEAWSAKCRGVSEIVQARLLFLKSRQAKSCVSCLWQSGVAGGNYQVLVAGLLPAYPPWWPNQSAFDIGMSLGIGWRKYPSG